ncbi:protein of unknown function [bacterium A37T11]|nr:protein of unknown function [bacterium A37T11]
MKRNKKIQSIINSRLSAMSCRRYIGFLLFIFCFLLFNSCNKEKIDFTHDYRKVNSEASASRIINLVAYTQVVANNDTLTNPQENGIPTDYFQQTGKLEGMWQIPKGIFDENGRADFVVSGNIPGPDGSGVTYHPQAAFSVTKFGETPTDYYTINPGGGNGQPWIVPVERSATPASKPDYFKIRVVNLSKAVDPLAIMSTTGPLEDLAGSVTLTYADGTPVSPRTSGVSIAQRASEYIELPYGTYQFKLLTADGRQISATVQGEDVGMTLMDPLTSSIPVAQVWVPTYLTNAPIRAYQPGGIYTIVVSPFRFMYGVGLFAWSAYQNQFKVIEDTPSPVNTRYGRVQVANALPGTAVSFRINRKSAGSALSFGEVSDYEVVEAGQYQVEAEARVGNVLVQLEHSLMAGHNHTIWLWRDQDGQPQLTVEQNDLSGVAYSTNVPAWDFANLDEDDASLRRYDPDMMFGTRFLNLSPNEPYVSFTVNNGADPRGIIDFLDEGTMGKYIVIHGDEARYNLSPGFVPNEFPYMWYRLDVGLSFDLIAYRSEPGIKPGVWIREVPALSSFAFVKNPLLYWQTGRPAPTFESGIYTVALIGRTGDVPDDQKARTMIVKHNK